MSEGRITMPLAEFLPPEMAREIFAYCPMSGVIRWKETGKGRHKKRDGIAGFKKGGEKYLRIKFRGRYLAVHRLAWCLANGEWPEILIDHINGDPSDNRIANLRSADKKTNAENQRRARSDSSTGVLGVMKYGDRFTAQIRTDGKAKYLGIFDSVEDAHKAYLREKRKIHDGCSI